MAKIRIIDDDVDFAENIVAILKGEGHELSHTDTVDGAVDSLVADKPDVLILDVMFPENTAGGFDTARAIREREELKDLPIIMLTAVNQEFPMDFSSQDIDPDWMPVQDFVEKPVEPSILVAKVNKLLGG